MILIVSEEPVEEDLQHDDEEAHEHHLSVHQGVGGVALQVSGHKYRVVQLDSTPEIEVFYMCLKDLFLLLV